jgi:cytochrome c peroxidase
MLLSACGGNDSPPTAPDTGVGSAFVNFETGQVRPLALSADGDTLVAVNTPNATLDILMIGEGDLQTTHSVPVGLEPVAVAINDNSEAWVVNHLSDSISVVDLTLNPPRVTKTLLTGDEPRDIVFAGSDGHLAFVTAAHRGQNGPEDKPIDATLQTPGIGRADVWVFDVNNTGTSLGGDPLSVTTVFAQSLRSLAVSTDGTTVYAAAFHSGNQTTAVGENELSKPGPTTGNDGILQPDTGLIVQFDGSDWRDETKSTSDLNGTSYNSLVPFTLPDYDIFALTATANPTVQRRVSGVGTTLFNMTVNPTNGGLYVSNTEALNVNRFEGHSTDVATLTGNFAHSRISVVSDDGVVINNLNDHIDHSSPADTTPAIAQPLGMAFSGDTLYVSAFASGMVAAYSSLQATPTQIPLSGGGPTGLVVDNKRNKLYVLTRFNNSISVVDLNTHTQLNSIALSNPEPATVTDGRRFLYDATDTSSHGDASCGLCHVFGDTDALAWDLGNPSATVAANPNAFVNRFLAPDGDAVFHPLKGPMTTQSLRGLANAGPMHWRGDRTGVSAADNESLELAAFKEFNVAFPELLGRASPLPEADMHKFARFALTIQYPPNPIRSLDNSLTDQQSRGLETYMSKPTTGEIFTCNNCHTLDPASGHFGTSGLSSVEGDDISQEFKVPHLRNLYQKVGKFGNSGRFSGTTGDFGAQVSGYGFMHDGNMDTLQNFFKGSVFHFDDDPAVNDTMIRELVDFIMAIDSNMAPIVGQQITLSDTTSTATDARIELLKQRAQLNECDLIAKGVVDTQLRGYLLQPNGDFQSDAGDTITYAALRTQALRPNGAVTFTCVPPGSGQWMGIDRNLDGTLDGQSNS